jgi:hypothetical protein
LFPQKPEQVDLEIIPGTEVGVTALGGMHVVSAAFPDEKRFPKAGARSHQRNRSAGLRRSFLQGNHVGGPKQLEAVADGLEIVDQFRMGHSDCFRQLASSYVPRQIRGITYPVDDRTRDSKAGTFGSRPGVPKELLDNRGK